eukprot:2248397-Alexandrium_andersonii.AAC.1
MSASLVGSEMCIRDSSMPPQHRIASGGKIACTVHSKNEWSPVEAVDGAARTPAAMSRKRRAAA